MKKVFVDTNIVIDLLARRDPFYKDAAALFSLADNKRIKLSTSALSFANTSYILFRKMNPDKAKPILRKLRLIVNTLAVNDKIIGLALNDDHFLDYEDGIQYYTALENRQDIIITRNLKDFRQSTLPCMTAQQFLETV